MKHLAQLQKTNHRRHRLQTGTKRFVAGTVVIIAAVSSQISSVAHADVPKLRVTEVCSSAGHDYVEVNVFNDRDTPLTVTASARNKSGAVVTTDTLLVPAHGSNGQNFNTGVIEGGSITYTESAVPGNVLVNENVCGSKAPAATTTTTVTTSTTRVTTSTILAAGATSGTSGSTTTTPTASNVPTTAAVSPPASLLAVAGQPATTTQPIVLARTGAGRLQYWMRLALASFMLGFTCMFISQRRRFKRIDAWLTYVFNRY